MTNRNGQGRNRQAGFTLIELMITIVIGSILLAIAIPGYQSQMRRSRRTEARMAVLDLASREERFLSTANNYSQIPTDLGYTGTTFPINNVGSGYYNLNVTVVAGAAGAAPTYTITATATGLQINDTACRTFTVNSIGQQTATDSSGAATTACWN